MIATFNNPVAAIVRRLQAKQSGSGFMARCPAHEDRDPSLSIKEGEDGRVLLFCHGGCAVEDILAALGLSMKDLFPADTPRAFPVNPPRKEVVPVVPPPMPESVSKDWWEGVDYLQGQPELIRKIAKFRSWPPPVVNHMVESLGLSMPKQGNVRGIAWLVVSPEGVRGDMKTRPVGYHLRMQKGCNVPWLYRPNENQDRQSIPALPFILGDFDTARLLIIAEGEWDIITFGLAAGWLGDGCVLPEGVGLIGIRGANGTEVFLRHYRTFWPRQADCLVIHDNDEAGRKWCGPGSFSDRLRKLCRRVAVVTTGCDDSKDLNDLYRRGLLGPEQIAGLLAEHHMTVPADAEKTALS